MYARSPAQVRRPRTAQSKQFTAPIGGWVSNRALANPAEPGVPQGAAVLDNFFPRSGSVKLRRGRQLYATLIETDKNVTALFSYRNGLNERLFGANDETIYDLTTVLSPYSAEIVDDVGDLIETEGGDWFGFGSTDDLQVMENLTGGDWIVVQFATTGGVYLIGVNGEDDGFIFDGETFWPNLAGGVFKLSYDAETTPFVAGEVVTGGTSAATGTIYKNVSTGVGEGYLLIFGVTGTFTDNEALTGSIAGAATADGSQVTASPGVTFGASGLTVADMSFVWVYKNRLWFVQKDSLNAWYMEDADAIGGNAVVFPLAGVFGLGGALLFGQNWSLGTSDQGGLGEQNVFVSTQGEVAIYQGADPGTADDWGKVGVYRIGTPLGKRAFFRGGGDLAIATSVGLVPLSKAIELDITSLNIATVSYNIADAWDTATSLRGLDDWICELWPEQKMAIISPPDLIGSTSPVLFISNTETGAWARYTGWYVLCMEVFKGQLYFGTTEGRVYLGNVSGLDEADAYTGTCIPLHEDLGSPGAVKNANIARGVSRANTTINAQVSVVYDFDMVPPAAPDASVGSGGNVWGVAVWGQAVWGQGTPTVINQEWQSAGGLGYTLAPCYQVTSGSIGPLDDELISLQVNYTTAELVS